jgi:hypothetical protein
MKNSTDSRRRFIKSSAFGLIGITAFSNTYSKNINQGVLNSAGDDKIFYRYPSMNDDQVSAVVGASHSDLDKVKSLVSQRSELALATWDWGFGDWETALGAASHVGRKDIAEFLIKHGARPDIFTMAMLGNYKAVQNMVEAVSGIQTIPGPHGITLLAHAKSRLRLTDLFEDDRNNINKTVSYLEGLGNADIKAKSLDIAEEVQKLYLGEYRFGDGADEIFTVELNSRKMLSLGRKGYFGRVMNKIEEHVFAPGGAPSVRIRFTIKDSKAVSFSVHEPEPIVTAVRI